MPALAAQGWDCYAVSLRGHGGSPGTVRGARIGHYVDDVAAAVRGMSAPPVLIGHSMGGFVVQKYLEHADHPARAAALIASVPHGGAAGYVLRQTLGNPLGVFGDMIRLTVHSSIRDEATTRQNFFSPALPAADVRRHHTRMQDESFLAVLDFAAFDLLKITRIQARALPMLVVAAEGDTLFSVAELRGTAQAYAAQFEVVSGAHDVMLDTHHAHSVDLLGGWLRTAVTGDSL